MNDEQEKALKDFLKEVVNLDKAWKRLSQGKRRPTYSQTEKDYKATLDCLLTSLKNPFLAEILNPLLEKEQKNDSSNLFFREGNIEEKNKDVIEIEKKLISSYGFKKQDIEKMFFFLKKEKKLENVNGLGSTNDLIERFNVIQINLTVKLGEAKDIPKKEKNMRKRELRQGFFSGTFGLCAIGANVFVAPSFPISYSIGIAALALAGRDFIP